MRQPSYHFINASVAWQALDKGVTLRLFANNILNEAVASQIATLSGLSYIADYTNPPRTIGGSVRVAF
nr:TonB-dependent receptor [Sphingobium fuliginis]